MHVTYVVHWINHVHQYRANCTSCAWVGQVRLSKEHALDDADNHEYHAQHDTEN